MKKRFLAIFLALVMCVGLAPTVFAVESESDFVIDEDGVLTKYNGPGGDVVIPSSVTSIGEYAFDGCTSLTSVTIPSSVTYIGEAAFFDCTSLTSVTIPNSVTSIGSGAFIGTPWLEGQGEFPVVNGILLKYQGDGGNVTIPTSVTSIGDRAFYGCTSLTGVTIPSSVTSIGEDAFYGCKSLTSVTIPSSVTSIGDRAFQDCKSLTSVAIPDSVTSIERSAFYGCTSLTSVTIPSSVTSIGVMAFRHCASISVDSGNPNYTAVDGVLFSKDMTLLHTYPRGKQVSSYNIPDGVTSIGEFVFYSRTDLTSVTIPSSVTSIGDYAFLFCTGLTSVTIPDSVTSIGIEAFNGCTNLTSVTIPTSVTSIERSAFSGTNLTDVYYGGSEAQWKAIVGYKWCGIRKDATIHYNASPALFKFPDLKPDGFYVDAVGWAVANGITAGTSATTFSSDQTCTHVQILTFLWRAAGEPASSAALPVDITGKNIAYAETTLRWAAEKGMIGKSFDPMADCTRADAVNYIWQAAGKASAGYDGRFADVPTNSPYAQAVAWALDKGVTAGTGDTTFSPDNICNRGQIVTFLHRYFGK